MSEKIFESIGNASEGFFELPLARQLILLVGLSASIALGIYMVLWTKTPNYEPLYTQLSIKDSGDVVDALSRVGIEHKLDEKTGIVLVDASKLQEAKIKLASLGVPGHAGNGFEILDKETVFGASQLVERARYIRALEGELEKTIASIGSIKSARVHLALPKQTSFLKDKKEASASVFVDIYGRGKLEAEQVAAITHLVASSIQGLSVQHVTVIDQSGKLLSSIGNDSMSGATKQLDYTSKFEKMTAQRIHDLLTPILGYGSVKAEITADIDFISFEETSESFDPEKTVIRSEKTSQVKKAGSDDTGVGMPGAGANTPANPVEAPKDKNAKTQVPIKDKLVMPEGLINQNMMVNYDVDRKVKYQQHLPGKLLKLSAAVVVDDKITYDKQGKMTKTPLTKEEMEKIENLVKDAIGYNKERGDRVTIINSSFAQAEPIKELPKQKIYEKIWFATLTKQGITAFIALALILLVLRPIIHNLTSVSRYKRSLLNEISKHDGGDHSETKKLSENEYNLKIKEIIAADPQKAAQIVKNWISK